MIEHGVARYGAAAPPVNANVGTGNEYQELGSTGGTPGTNSIARKWLPMA